MSRPPLTGEDGRRSDREAILRAISRAERDTRRSPKDKAALIEHLKAALGVYLDEAGQGSPREGSPKGG